LPQIDPDGGLHRYLDLQPHSVSLFKDFFSNILPTDYLEYSQVLREGGASNDSANLISRLRAIAQNVKNGSDRPLTGLKIAIDPGHMGPAPTLDLASGKMSDWDRVTGKFVQVQTKFTKAGKRFVNNRKVSEGQLNLWTALLTANELEALGAEVRLTRTQDGTVTTETVQNFNSAPFLNQYFYNSLDAWMSDYLHLSDDDLAREIIKAPQAALIKTPTQQVQQLFIAGADLEARAKIIDAFNPDITLDIHFDASRSDALQKSTDDVEAYVPGAFRQSETGSRNVRAMALKHLLEARRWNESVNLATTITGDMAQNLNLPLFKAPAFMTAVKVKDGVYARNLFITRRALSGLVVYLECLHYDHVNEHSKLSVLDGTAQFKGSVFKYPTRLNKISDGIRSGLLKYFVEQND
jgi:N-acetylmuramoyl-L-alanine amidase